jgi:hypothetical protein
VWGKTYVLPANARKVESVALENPPGGSVTFVVRMNGVENRIECGHGTWKRGQASVGSGALQRVAASGAWTAADTFTAKLCLYETPFVHTVTLKFAGDEVRYSSEANAAFGPTKEPELVGTLAASAGK